MVKQKLSWKDRWECSKAILKFLYEVPGIVKDELEYWKAKRNRYRCPQNVYQKGDQR